MRIVRVLVLACMGAAALLPVHAQKIAPGLWEIRSNMSSGDGKLQQQMAEMQKQMAQLPPEQRKMMEEVLARQGMGMDVSKGMPTVRICVSKEQAERDVPPMELDSQCRFERFQRRGSTMRFAFVCTDPAGRGEGEIKFQGDKAYTSHMTSETTVGKGRVERMTIDQQSRWISADCGKLKPLPER
ncbi:MAG TPA: DUF3617 domain-containing protein [Rubrivivax sp.]|nr:DUF3617 domain-containing protein [Burkholderiales bacterium]HNT40289.1 DUF3617 domain-containing protein [Rubrivivax sp.]